MIQRAIRGAVLSDARPIAELMLEHELWRAYDLTLDGQVIKLQVLILDTAQSVYVAAGESGSIDGFIVFDTRTFGSAGYIQLLGVRRSLAGRQIGDDLIRAAHAEMRKTTHKCLLLCTSWNKGAQRFYEKHGYTQVGELKDWVKPGIDELIFSNPDI